MRFAYADPPYLGKAKRLYGKFHDDAARWDDPQAHRELVIQLQNEYPDGWALSCNPKDLAVYLPECPENVRIASWVKSFHQIRPKLTVQHAWEAVLWVGGREEQGRKPMVRDWLLTKPTNRKGLPGAKPPEFNRWILDLLNFKPGDTVEDLFPGTHGMAAAQLEAVLL